jgi:RNA polymerase sigma factor (sigma-70 family)
MSHSIIRDYLRVSTRHDPTGPADEELLARFVKSRDETAFELLVWRHAALVQHVCRGVLGDHHAAEDAAQAVFLILARKAHTFDGRGSAVGWLYRIARRVSIRLAKERARGPNTSHRLDQLPVAQQVSVASTDELEALCVEVDRLPERYRVPVLLCFFEGLTHREAARRTGWVIGTVAGRLARAKGILARRLSRKGIGLATLVLALPAGNFVGGTARAAVAFANRCAIVPGIDSNVTHLAEGVLKTMTASKIKLFVVSSLGCLAIATGWAWTVTASPQPQDPPATALAAQSPAAAQQPVKPKQPAPKERIATRKDQIENINALKQIMLAMHNYHEATNELPHDITDKDGKPLLSWRVAILPYIEQQGLYMMFKRDEPWDSEHNKKLIAKMPDLYRLGFQGKEETKTFIQVFAGPGTPFEPGQKIRLADITDGTSNTLGPVAAGSSVEWTKPADIAYDPKKPLPKLEVPFKNLFSAAFLDGHVLSFKPDMDAKVLKMLIERGDGEIVPDLGEYEVKVPLAKDEIDSIRGILKEDQRLLAAIGDQLKEHEKQLEELAKKSNLNELQVAGDAFGFRKWPDPHVLAEILEELKKKNEELKKVVEGGKEK